jgi:diamine N-acetyltransferase
MLTIRSATQQDIPTIHTLAHSIWQPTFRDILSQEQIAYMLEVMYAHESLAQQMQQGHYFLMAEWENAPVGYASYSHKSQEITHLHKIYLLPETQGKGIGKHIITYIEKQARQAGATALELCVNRYNNAKQMYEKIGFVVLREEDFAIGSYWMNDFVMRKELL